MNEPIRKYSIIKRKDLKFLKWCAVNQNDLHDGNRFFTKKSAIRWAHKRQSDQSHVAPLESYVVLEDGSVISNQTST